MDIIDLRHGFVRRPFAAFKRRARKNNEHSAQQAQHCEHGGEEVRRGTMEDGDTDTTENN